LMPRVATTGTIWATPIQGGPLVYLAIASYSVVPRAGIEPATPAFSVPACLVQGVSPVSILIVLTSELWRRCPWDAPDVDRLGCQNGCQHFDSPTPGSVGSRDPLRSSHRH